MSVINAFHSSTLLQHKRMLQTAGKPTTSK